MLAFISDHWQYIPIVKSFAMHLHYTYNSPINSLMPTVKSGINYKNLVLIIKIKIKIGMNYT